MSLKKPSDFFSEDNEQEISKESVNNIFENIKGETLKTPSDFFSAENGLSILSENAESLFENYGNYLSEFQNKLDAINSLENYGNYLSEFHNKLNTINSLSEEVSSIKSEIVEMMKKDDVNRVILSHLIFVNDSIDNIKSSVKSINEEKLQEIRNDTEFLLSKVEKFVDEDIPKHNNNLVFVEHKIENIGNKIDEVVGDLTNSEENIKDIEQVIDTQEKLGEQQQQRIEYIESYLKKSALGSFKKYLTDRVSRIESDVTVSETRIKKQNVEIDSIKKEIYETIQNLKVSELTEANKNLSKKINVLEKLFNQVNDKKFSDKLEELQKKYDKFDISEEAVPDFVTTGDPLTPLDKKYVTLEQLQDHYRLFINRIQQQIYTIGGGGAGYLGDLSDVNVDLANADGKFLRYNAEISSFDFAEPEVAFNVGVDGPYTLGQVGIGTTSIQTSPYPNNSLLVWGNARIVGIFTVGTESITLDPNTGRIASGDIEVVNEDGGASYTGTVHAGQLSAGIRTDENIIISCGETGKGLITSPAELIIDPAVINNNTGIVRIKGDLIVEGTETKIESQTLEVADKTIGIASTTPKLNDSQLDGAGIIIHGSDSDKSLVWDNSNSRLSFSTTVYAPYYYGDGSNLTGIVPSTNIVNNGQSVGTATTINFADNLDVEVSQGIATVSANIALGDLSNVDTSNLGAGTTNYLLVYDPTIPGFKFIDPTTIGINNDFNPDPNIDDFGTY